MGFSKEKNGFHKDYKGGNLVGSGNYKNGKRVGKWKIYETSNNNRSYVSQIGYYKDGLKHGEWISYYSPNFDGMGYDDLIRSIKHYENGHKTRIKEYFPNGQLWEIGSFKNDQKVGEWKTYYDNGQIRVEKTYENGLIQGELKMYEDNGEILHSHYHKDGKSNFEGKNSYFEDGKLVYVYEYKNGRKIRYQEYFDNGNIKVDCELDGELDHGKRIYYFKDGQINEIHNYKQGVLHGEWKFFNHGGRPVLFKTYRDGILHGEYRRYSGVGFPWVDIVNYENGLKQGECRNYVGEKYDVLTSICYFVDDEIQDETKEYNPDGSFKGYGSIKANIEKREKEKLELQVG